MAYIGRIPQVGNYFTLDAITTSATDTFNLLKGGVAYVPESAYHIFVSLNGVIQAPITAYTVSGSTIIFDSALASTDVIDFITVLGDTLAIGTPSDATVTDAKIVDMAATKLTGSIADARVPASAVTQHVTGYDDSAIRADISALALREATNETSAAFNLPNSFIDTFTDDTNLGTQTTVDRISGYISSIYTSSAAFTNDANTQLLLHMDDTSLIDSSSNSITTTASGATDPARSATQSKFGGYSCYVDGSTNNNKLSMAANANLNIGANDFTVEFWAYPTKSGATQVVWMSLDDGSGYANTHIWLHSNNTWQIHGSNNGSSWNTLSGNSIGAATLNTWQHIAVARDGTTVRFYKDGVQADTVSIGTTSMGTNTEPVLFYESSYASGQGVYGGYLDEFRFSNTCRYPNGTTFTPNATTVTSATGTLIQSANAVGSAKTEVSGTILYKDNAGTATLGTDLKIYFTCNGGSNWTEAASYNAITPVYATGIKQVRLGKTTCTSGTDVRYKAVWANQAASSKETQLHGIGINY